MKKYDFDLLLTLSSGSYMLVTIEGRKLYNVRHPTKEGAMREALNYASSWHSVRIRFEEEYEQEKKRAGVSDAPAADDSELG